MAITKSVLIASQDLAWLVLVILIFAATIAVAGLPFKKFFVRDRPGHSER